MSANSSNLMDRIPKDKLAEIANGFSADTTAQQAVQALAASGIEATEAEAQELLGSLFAKKTSLQPLGDDIVDAIAGGYCDPLFSDTGSYDPNANNSSCVY